MRNFLLHYYHLERDLIRHWLASKVWKKLHTWAGFLHFCYFTTIVIGAKELYIGAAALQAFIIVISIFVED